MRWLFPFLHSAGLLSAARLPLQVAVLTYVGAGGLAGAAVVGGVILSPAGEIVQEAVAPARHSVESVLPMGVPRAVASQPIGDARSGRVPSPIVETAPLTFDDATVEDVVPDATPTPQARVVSPLQSGPLAQPTQPSLRPSVAEQPVAAIERVVPVMPGRPAVAIAVSSGARPDVAVPAPATAAPASTRVAINGANSDNQRAAAVSLPTSIAVHVLTSRIEAAPTAAALPASRQASIPATAATLVPVEVPTPAPSAAPALAPTVAPTQAPTMAPTQVPTRAPTSVPTQEPKKTAAPIQTTAPPPVPTKGPARPPRATSAPTSGPAHAVPTAAPDRDEHPTPASAATRTEPLGRTADAPPPAKHESG